MLSEEAVDYLMTNLPRECNMRVRSEVVKNEYRVNCVEIYTPNKTYLTIETSREATILLAAYLGISQ